MSQKYFSMFLLACVLLTACAAQPAAPTATATLLPTSTLAPTIAPTAIPPTPTETAPVLTLDKPMTTQASMEKDKVDFGTEYYLDHMPTISRGDIESRMAANTVVENWKNDPALFDKVTGKWIVPTEIKPIENSDWYVADSTFGMFTLENEIFPSKIFTSENSPFFSSFENFKISEVPGEEPSIFSDVVRVYMKDKKGDVSPMPIFCQWDLDKVDLSGESDYSRVQVFKINGTSKPTLTSVTKFFLSKAPTNKHIGSLILADFNEYIGVDKYLQDSMSPERQSIVDAISNGIFEQEILSKVLLFCTKRLFQ